MKTLVERLKQHEGFRAEPYRCPAGFWSIGYGHYMGEGGCHISRHVAEVMLQEDIQKAELEYYSLGWTHLNDTRKDVVIELIFWHGFRGFLKFRKCVAAIEKSDWDRAADEMMDSQSGRRYTERMAELAGLMRHGQPGI